MGVRYTLDTNILVYAIDASQGARHTQAASLVIAASTGQQPLMLQSLNELANVIQRKRLISGADLNDVIRFHRNAFVLHSPNVDDLLDALRAQEDHKLPLWDALLWATARRAGCRILFTEDFQDGRELGGVRLINPFKLSRKELQALTI